MKSKNKLTPIIEILITLIFTGTIGYKYLLDLSFVNALYMIVITISTVGYQEVGITDTEAKFFQYLSYF